MGNTPALGDNMEHSRLESVARALESLNGAELVAHYAPGFWFEAPAAGLVITDHDELRRYFEALFSMPEVGFHDVTVFEDESSGTVPASGSGPGSARRRQLPGERVLDL